MKAVALAPPRKTMIQMTGESYILSRSPKSPSFCIICAFLISMVVAVCTIHNVLVDLITLITFGQEYSPHHHSLLLSV